MISTRAPFYGPFIHLHLTRFLKLNPAVNPNRTDSGQKDLLARVDGFTLQKLNVINSKSL